MVYIVYLLAAVGLAFLIGNRIAILHRWAAGTGRWAKLLDSFLECSFCRGCFAGVLTWGASWIGGDVPLLIYPACPVWGCPVIYFIWMLACGAVTLGAEVWMDKRSHFVE